MQNYNAHGMRAAHEMTATMTRLWLGVKRSYKRSCFKISGSADTGVASSGLSSVASISSCGRKVVSFVCHGGLLG